MAHKTLTNSAYIFDYIFSFRITNKDIQSSIKEHMQNPMITTTYKNNEIIFKQNYLEELDNRSCVDCEIKVDGFEVRLQDFEQNLSKITLDQTQMLKKAQDHFFGKSYTVYGIRPFIVELDDKLLGRGTANVTYLGLNLFSLHLRITCETQLTFEAAVELGTNLFSITKLCTLESTSFTSNEGIVSLAKYYSSKFCSSFGKEITIVHTFHEVLTAVDYSPNAKNLPPNNEVFLYLNQPMEKNSPLKYKSDYVNNFMMETDMSNYSNMEFFVSKHRSLLSFKGVFDSAGQLPQNITKERVIYELQAQTLLPLKKILGNYCIMYSLEKMLEQNQSFRISELEAMKSLFKFGLKSFSFDENYKFQSVNELLPKLKHALKYHDFEIRISDYISTIEQILNEKTESENLKRQRLVGSLVGLIPIVLGISAIKDYVDIAQKLKISFAILHPFRLTLILWVCLVVLTSVIYLLLAFKKNTIIDVKEIYNKSLNRLLKRKTK